jgi:hypothetical protein
LEKLDVLVSIVILYIVYSNAQKHVSEVLFTFVPVSALAVFVMTDEGGMATITERG